MDTSMAKCSLSGWGEGVFCAFFCFFYDFRYLPGSPFRIFHRNFVTFVRRLLGVTLIPLILPNCRLVVFFASCNVRVFDKKHLADLRVVMKLPVVVCL